MSLFHEIIMNFIIEKRCYNGGLEVIFFIICIKLDGQLSSQKIYL